jgi:hypothetical protein
MTRAQALQLFETIQPFRPYAKKMPKLPHDAPCDILAKPLIRYAPRIDAGWSSPIARHS